MSAKQLIIFVLFLPIIIVFVILIFIWKGMERSAILAQNINDKFYKDVK